jgi:hypothetical protein
VGRALRRLGIEHILSYSPQARGRSERVNGTLQDRLVNEWRLAGISTVAPANRYLRPRFLPAFNAEGRPSGSGSNPLTNQRLNGRLRIEEGVIEAQIAKLDEVLGQDPEAANAFFREHVRIPVHPGGGRRPTVLSGFGRGQWQRNNQKPGLGPGF